MEKHRRVVLLDWMKAVSILCVIITHMDLYGRGIPINYMLNCLIVAMAVPVFLMISGYNMVNEQIYKQLNAGGGYRIGVLQHQIAKIIPSYTLIFLIETGLLFLNGQFDHFDWIYFILSWLTGGRGPGGYYVPIMIQLFLVMPIIAFIICKKPVLGLFTVCAVNAVFELVVKLFSFPAEIYRLFIGRYLFLLAVGAFLKVSRGKKIGKVYLFASLMIGLLYICITNYFCLPDGTYSWSLFKDWQMTAFPVAFYLFPILYLLIKNLYDIRIETWVGTVMQKIGSRTWYIYCIQMLYFLVVYEMYGFKFILRKIPLIFEFLVNFLLCIIGGFLLYYLDRWVRSRVRQHR